MSPGRGSLEVADLDDDDEEEEEEEEEESDDDVRVLASARCCRRRGGDATINIRWEVGGGRVTQGGVEVVAVSERGEPLPPSRRPLRLRRPLRSRRWPLSFGSEEEVAEMTATAMSSRWLQRKRAVDADESGWGEEEGRRARQRMMDAGRRRTTTTTTTKTQQSNIEREREKKDGGDDRRRAMDDNSDDHSEGQC